MLILDADIPDFLRTSTYLLALVEQDGFPKDGIDVPEGCVKKSLSVRTKADLVDFVRTLRFWLLPDLVENSVELLHFAFSPANKADICEVCAEFKLDLPYLACLSEAVCSATIDKTAVAARGGYVSLLLYLHDELGLDFSESAAIETARAGHCNCLEVMCTRGLILTSPVYKAAALHGHLPCLKYLILQDEFGLNAAVSCAAEGGHFDCIKFLIDCVPGGKQLLGGAYKLAAEHGHVTCLQSMMLRWALPKRQDQIILFSAAKMGQLEVLRWGVDAGLQFDINGRALTEAVSGGHLHCVKYLCSLGHALTRSHLQMVGINNHTALFAYLLERDCPVSLDVTRGVASRGHLELLKLAHEKGAPWDEQTCSVAAHSGHLDCLQYAHQHGCPWDKLTTHQAALMGHIECLRYAHENGCPWETHAGETTEHTPHWQEDICVSAARAATTDCLEYVLKHGVFLRRACAAVAIKHRSVAVMCLLHDRHRFAWSADDCRMAATFNSVDCLQFLHEIGTPWDERVCYTAVVSAAQNLDILKYALENDCPWDAEKCLAAAHNLDCIRYLHKVQGCALNSRLVFFAAQLQDLPLLQYLHEHRCPWSVKACTAVSQLGNLACLRFLHKHGCPWYADTCRLALTRSVYNYAVENGCPGAELSRFKDPLVLIQEDNSPDVSVVTKHHPPSTECILG